MTSRAELVSELLGDHHDTSTFDCGQPALDDWLRTSARDSDGRGITRTYVWHRGDGVVLAYYTLMPFTIEKQELGKRKGRGLPDRIPCYLLARLALEDTADLRGMRLGSALLAEALSRATAAALDVGGRFVVVDAIDETAASFYAHHGFVPVPGVRDRLLIRVEDVATKLGW